jgi:ribosomal protein S18 acetylase RimI-like enzyme
MNDETPILRGMTADDVPQTVPLLAQLGYQMTAMELARRMRGVLSAPDHAILVAEIKGRVTGLMHVFARPAVENPREAVVQSLVVDAAYRRTGVGRSLMTAAERWGSEHDCRSVVLSSNITRAPAHAFYERLGYRVSATSYILRKALPPGIAMPSAEPAHDDQQTTAGDNRVDDHEAAGDRLLQACSRKS